jgi:transposase
VRQLTADERAPLETGLRSPSAFTVRRCQILLARAAGQSTTTIARHLHCTDQTVRNAIHTFHQRGLAVLQPQSSRPHTLATIFDAAACESLRALLHQSPRTFGKPTSRWTLALAAEVSFAQGLTPRLVSDEAIRLALRRLGVAWMRAKPWITSPDPAYLQKKTARPPDPAGPGPPHVGAGLWRRSLVESAGPARPPLLDGQRGHAQVTGVDPTDGRS